jgi:hypothetical protein
MREEHQNVLEHNERNIYTHQLVGANEGDEVPDL